MKTNEKRMILILVVITIIVIAITVVVKNNKKKAETNPDTGSELTQNLENGSKVNTSEQLKQTKKVDDMELTDIQLTEVNGEATIRANATNNTAVAKKEFAITINVLNKNGEKISEVGAMIGSTKPGETRQINASINMSINEVYDFIIEKK